MWRCQNLNAKLSRKETEARDLFDGGIFVDSHGADAVNDTKQYIETGTQIVFQATFQEDVFFIRADVLVKNG